MSEVKHYTEIELKFDASGIDRLEFKALAKSLNPTSFLYVESKDVYYVRGKDDFLRYRMPPESTSDKRAELTFKKKRKEANNVVRTEVNLRVDLNTSDLVNAFCEGLGYKRSFSITKLCDIYYFEKGNIVFYSVIDESGGTKHFVEAEANEDIGLTEDEAWEVVQGYEKLLAPLGITPQKRKRLSLFEMYVKYDNEATEAKTKE